MICNGAGGIQRSPVWVAVSLQRARYLVEIGASEFEHQGVECLDLLLQFLMSALRAARSALPISARLPNVTVAFCPTDPYAVGTGWACVRTMEVRGVPGMAQTES